MKKFKFKIRGNKYEVEINNFENNIAEIEVNGTKYEVEVEQEIKKQKTPKLVRAKVPTTDKGSKLKKDISTKKITIVAPLAGTIIKIMTKEGDEIKRGQTLMTMEAMKMENNILAEKDGVVKAIKVSEGQNVLQNDVLVEMG